MLTKPKVEECKEQPYVAIRTKVNMDKIPEVLPPLIPQVFNWLTKNNIVPVGPLFFQYLCMDKNNDLVAEVGVPVKDNVKGEGQIISGSFPPGYYATVTYIGDYKHIREAHIALRDWVKKNDYKEKEEFSENGIKWGRSIEFYLTDPAKEPDPDKWRTDIVLLVEEDKVV